MDKNIIGPRLFKTYCNKDEDKKRFIPDLHASSNASLHKFRDFDKDKWVSKNDFKKYFG